MSGNVETLIARLMLQKTNQRILSLLIPGKIIHLLHESIREISSVSEETSREGASAPSSLPVSEETGRLEAREARSSSPPMAAGYWRRNQLHFVPVYIVTAPPVQTIS